MTPDPRANPESVGTISVRYRMLLGQYCRERKKVEKEENKESRQYFSNLLKGRKGVSDAIPPERRERFWGREGFWGYWAATLDLFRNEIVDSGGIGVLESLFALDAATLAALIEWNRINLLRIEQRLFTRRLVVFVIAALGVAGQLSKFNVFGNQIVKEILRIYGQILLGHWWSFVLAVSFVAFLEAVLWRPGKSRIEEFGQMLAVAFAYVSKMPSPGEHKIKDAPEGG
jgi:hypothetical protein